MDAIPIPALFVGMVVFVLLFLEAGYRAGARAHRRSDKEKESPVSVISGSILGLTGFMLAFSFGMYGLVRKVISVDALAGFASETLLLAPLGIAYIVWCELAGSGVLTTGGIGLNLLLMIGGPVTAIPLVLFAFGARRIPYSTVGLLQYIGPTIQMLLAVFVFGEAFSGPRVLGFVLIWTALALYAGDGIWRARKMPA